MNVYGKGIFTDKGISVGSTEAEVFRKYGKRVKAEPHFYSETGKYLIINTFKNHRIIFETEKGIVTMFRTGKVPSVDYEEGCQ